jgi:hypothetical protein
MGRIGCARLILAATLALGGRAIQLHAQGTVDVAQAFIRAVYNDLRIEGNAFSVSLSPTLSTVGADAIWSQLNYVGVRVLRPLDPEAYHRPPTKTIDPDRIILDVSLQVGIDDRVWNLRSKGSHVRTADLESMVRFADSHRDWTDARLVAELKRRGARYTDEAPGLDAADLNRFEPFVGLILDHESEFIVRTGGGRPEVRDSFDFVWIVSLRTRPGLGETQGVTLVFEPFEGRLISLNRFLR